MKTGKNSEQDTSSQRRDFLKTAGRVGIYTPPALLLLMNPSISTFAESAGAKCNNGLGNDTDCPVNEQINNDVSGTPGLPARK